MKKRILKDWNLRRLIFIGLGGITAIMAFIDGDWLVGSFGLFVALIGMFSLGCTSGNTCEIHSTNPKQASKREPIQYEEVK